MYKTFTSIYLTTGSRVKTAKEINSIIKFKDGGGLLWSKISAGIPHCERNFDGAFSSSFKTTFFWVRVRVKRGGCT